MNNTSAFIVTAPFVKISFIQSLLLPGQKWPRRRFILVIWTSLKDGKVDASPYDPLNLRFRLANCDWYGYGACDSLQRAKELWPKRTNFIRQVKPVTFDFTRFARSYRTSNYSLYDRREIMAVKMFICHKLILHMISPPGNGRKQTLWRHNRNRFSGLST